MSTTTLQDDRYHLWWGAPATVLQPHEPRLQPRHLDSMKAKEGVCCVKIWTFEAGKYCFNFVVSCNPISIHCSFFSSWALKSPALVLHPYTPSHPIVWLELHGYKPEAKVINFHPQSPDTFIGCLLPFWQSGVLQSVRSTTWRGSAWELPEHSLCVPFLPKQGAVLHFSNNQGTALCMAFRAKLCCSKMCPEPVVTWMPLYTH